MAVVNQPRPSNPAKILPGDKSSAQWAPMVMQPEEKTLKKILPDKRFLSNVLPTSEAVVKLLDGVDEVVINQKVEVLETTTGLLSLGCCKVWRF